MFCCVAILPNGISSKFKCNTRFCNFVQFKTCDQVIFNYFESIKPTSVVTIEVAVNVYKRLLFFFIITQKHTHTHLIFINKYAFTLNF